MKRVFNNSYSVIHLFANLTENERYTRDARCVNVFFQDGVLYSYGTHFVLAKYIQDKKGELFVLANNSGYSLTTTKHQSQVRVAMSHHNLVYCPDPSSVSSSVKAWTSRANANLRKLINAKKPEIYLNNLASLEIQAQKYFQVIGEKMPKELKKLFAVKSKDEYVKLNDKLIKLQAKQRLAAIKAEKEKTARQVIEFKNFERDTLYAHESYLRYNSNTNRIQTSQRVEINYTSAKQLFEKIDSAIKSNNFENVIGLTILDRFKITQCDKNKFVAGCHRIDIKEVYAIANQLQWV